MIKLDCILTAIKWLVKILNRIKFHIKKFSVIMENIIFLWNDIMAIGKIFDIFNKTSEW